MRYVNPAIRFEYDRLLLDRNAPRWLRKLTQYSYLYVTSDNATVRWGGPIHNTWRYRGP